MVCHEEFATAPCSRESLSVLLDMDVYLLIRDLDTGCIQCPFSGEKHVLFHFAEVLRLGPCPHLKYQAGAAAFVKNHFGRGIGVYQIAL